MIRTRHWIHHVTAFLNSVGHDNVALSFSQEGEDMLLRSLLKRKKNGFYVDVGSHHPTRFSNTMTFYLEGWRGLNIDAMPHSMDEFKGLRPRDTNVESGVGKPGKLKFYAYDDPAVNTFDQTLVAKRVKAGYGHKVKKIYEIMVRPLSDILDDNLPSGQHIDFMSVDVEGKDFEVLQTNNWAKYHPDFLAVENYGVSQGVLSTNKLYKYLIAEGYFLVASTKNTMILQSEKYAG